MIRKSPSEYYIKYLVVSGLDNNQVKAACTAHELVWLGDWYITALRDAHRPPNPFLPDDPTHEPTKAFLIREMIKLAFYPNEAMKKALKLLEKPRARELVEVMVLSGAPAEAISYALMQRLEFSASTVAIELYRHYFWDTDLLDSSDMRALLRLKSEQVLQSPDPHVRQQYDALKKNFHNDPRVVAARLPVSPITGMLAQISVGVMPRDINKKVVSILESVRVVSALRALESALMGGPAGAQQGVGYMSMADMASNMLETVVKPEDQLRDDLMNIALKTSNAKVPVLHQLTAGKHTTDLAPEPKTIDTSPAPVETVEDDEDEPI